MPKRFTGILVTPLISEDYFHTPTILEGGGPSTTNTEAIARDLAARLKALYDHFGVDPGDADQLVLAMAHEYVPGFRMISNRETPVAKRTKWEPWRFSALLVAVELLKQKGMTGRGAVKHIAGNAKYKNITLGTKEDILREMYFRASKEKHNPLAPFIMRNPQRAVYLLKLKFPIR